MNEYFKGNKEYFPEIGKIKYEGKDSKNPSDGSKNPSPGGVKVYFSIFLSVGSKNPSPGGG